MFKIKKIHPMFSGIVTTATRYKGDQHAQTESGLIIDTRKLDGTMNPYQVVLAVGSIEHTLKEGDIVCINFNRYVVPEHRPGKVENNIESDSISYSYSFPCVTVNGQECLFLQSSDIDYYMRPSEGDCEIDDGGLLQ